MRVRTPGADRLPRWETRATRARTNRLGTALHPMTTAFVAGATGYTGREVVRQLVERGVRAVAHVRPDSPRLAEWRERFAELGAEVDATPWEEPAMRASLA